MRPPNISKADEAHNKKTKRLKVEIENVGSSSVGCRDVATSSFDFEKRRASFVLNKNEIWAVKDEFGMPRRYVFVWRGGDIQSAELHVLRNRDRSGRSRLGGGVARAWGIFDSGACHEPKDIPALSHKVEKLKNYNKVLPRTGEVWAIRAGNAETLFGDSSPTLLRYQMVEALTNFVENKGMKLVYLVSITGVNGNRFRRYQSAFHVQPDYVLERFSHQVPCMRVSGNDLLELDPSSLPLYVDDFETSVVPEINDNYLFLGLLDRMASANREFDDEIWATCDHDCRVPQKYVEIRHERRYQHQHKRRYHKAKHELIPIFTCDNEKKWQEAGLPIACGKFTVATVESERHFILSHRLSTRTRNYERTGDVYDINIDMYPKEGEVWGIYKDRNLVMACNPRGALYYQIVVIVGTTEKDVKVARLSRVEGFKGLFKKSSNLASGVEFLVPVNEFHRFSHTIPSYRFDEKCSKEFFRGAFVLNPFLVPLKHDEPYSFNDPFLAQIPKVQSSWSAIQYFVNKQRKSISMASQANSYEDSENCTLSLSVEQEQIIVENLREGEPNIGEISPAEVHVSERMECEADEHETIHHIKFHDFEDSKSESDVKPGEVWAFCNRLNKLPFSYARIDKFLNSGGMLDVTLLQPHPVADEEMQWVEANLPMACGTFRAAESTCIEKKLLLHRVICAHEQPSKLFFRVYPRKGEIWAIYNHWNIDWTISGMSTNVQYKLVEIVTDFTQEAGVTVAALVRAEEHDNVFRRQLHEGFWLFMTFKRKELLRFSHRIPSLKITGDQAGGCTSGGSFRVKFSHNGI